MKTTNRPRGTAPILLATLLASSLAAPARASIIGLSGTSPSPSFSLQAKVDHITTGEGGSFLLWGYANGAARAQYPGPTLIVNQGDAVTIDLTNKFPLTGTSMGQKVSMVFPGQEGVMATCMTAPCSAGLLTLEAELRNSKVRYTFTAGRPGTYLYHSGTSPELQVEMGLVGALIVRPTGFNPAAPRAYAHSDSAYDREDLFLLTEMDPRIHDTVEFQGPAALVTTDFLSDYFPNYFILNGRTGPDDLSPAGSILYPTQPYNCLPRMHPGERLLLRLVNAGRQQHPFHHHGNHTRVIARDGRLLTSPGGTGADMSFEVFSILSVPGETIDAIFTWTGKNLGWDIYGTGPEFAHTCTDVAPVDGYDDAGDNKWEWCADHGKPLPVILPENQSIAVGEFWSGSPFLGVQGALPPGQGNLNENGFYAHMWHSHTEKEITNFDIFPGGMMTFLIIEAPGVPIP